MLYCGRAYGISAAGSHNGLALLGIMLGNSMANIAVADDQNFLLVIHDSDNKARPFWKHNSA